MSSLRMAAKAHQTLFDGIRSDGGAHNLVPQMQTRAELYDTIGYHDYEALDASIIRSVVPPDNLPAERPE